MNIDNIIIQILSKKMGLIAVYLFGSFVNGNFNRDSDIDIAFITKDKPDSLLLFELANELSALINRDVHLIDFKTVTTILKIQVLKKNKLIYCSDDSERLFIEMNTLSEYEKLNEERSPVLKEKLGDGYGRYFK